MLMRSLVILEIKKKADKYIFFLLDDFNMKFVL